MAGPVRRFPFVLLALLTVATFGGPMGFGAILRGGPSPNWPPDRSVEWWALIGISAIVVVLMVICVLDGLVALRRAKRALTGTMPDGLPPQDPG